MQHSDLQIKIVPLTTIRGYWRNPRNNDHAVEPVAQSIKKYGFNVPITVDREGVILSGHTRYRAAMKLGMENIPVIYLDLDEEKAKEWRIADNKTSEIATWLQPDLLAELRELKDISEFQIFFPEASLQDLLSTGTEGAYKPVTQENIDKAQVGLDTRFDNVHARNMAEVACPQCGELFLVDKEEIMRQQNA